MGEGLKYGEAKRASHIKNIAIWRKRTGRKAFRPEEQYVTLADPSGMEFESVMSTGLLLPEQYHGVNDDPIKVAELKHKYPEGNFHCGDFGLFILRKTVAQSGGLIYVDTTSEPDQARPMASALLIATLSSCGPQSLVCFNFCLTAPLQGHRELSLDAFIQNFRQQISPEIFDRWAYEGYFEPPKTSITQMLCLFFWREL